MRVESQPSLSLFRRAAKLKDGWASDLPGGSKSHVPTLSFSQTPGLIGDGNSNRFGMFLPVEGLHDNPAQAGNRLQHLSALSSALSKSFASQRL
jgi:hypothetical protein